MIWFVHPHAYILPNIYVFIIRRYSIGNTQNNYLCVLLYREFLLTCFFGPVFFPVNLAEDTGKIVLFPGNEFTPRINYSWS